MEEKTGLLITPAQPGLHLGHIDALKQGIAEGITKVIIGVGSSNKELSLENPFTLSERIEMVNLALKELLLDLEVEIFPIPDFGTTKEWVSYIENELPPIDFVLTGNPWIQKIFQDKDKSVIPIEIKNLMRASTLREQIARGAFFDLSKTLPESVIEYLKSIYAFDRLKVLFQNNRKGPNLTVDRLYGPQKEKLF